MKVTNYLKSSLIGLGMLSLTSCATTPKIVDVSPYKSVKDVRDYDKLHAMIVCGTDEKEFVENAKKAYKEFKKLGCSDDDICLLAPSNAKDLEGIIDGNVYKYAVRWELDSFKSKVGQDDLFFFYFVDHGIVKEEDGASDSYICLRFAPNSVAETISVKEFQEFVNGMDAKCSIYFIDSCFSGGFSSLGKESNIVIATSSKDSTNFMGNKFGYYLLKALNYEKGADEDMDGSVSLKEAFKYASKKDWLSIGLWPFWEDIFSSA